MKVVIVEPLKAPYEKEIDPSLESMQAVVGGLIQAVYPFEDQEIALVCNEEGKFGRLPNRGLYTEDGYLYDIIFGTFFLCAAPSGSENFDSLNEEQIKQSLAHFSDIELYIPQ